MQGCRSADDDASAEEGWGIKLGLWCLNPALIFQQMAKPTRSVILTSGTLSPMDSFASELGVKFDMQLESPHVVDLTKQVGEGVSWYLNITSKYI